MSLLGRIYVIPALSELKILNLEEFHFGYPDIVWNL